MSDRALSEYACVFWLFTVVENVFLGWWITFTGINILLLVPSSKFFWLKLLALSQTSFLFVIVWWLVHTTFHAAFKVLFNIQENVCIGSVYQKYSSPHLFSWEVLKVLKRQFLIVFINSDWVTVVEKIF